MCTAKKSFNKLWDTLLKLRDIWLVACLICTFWFYGDFMRFGFIMFLFVNRCLRWFWWYTWILVSRGKVKGDSCLVIANFQRFSGTFPPEREIIDHIRSFRGSRNLDRCHFQTDHTNSWFGVKRYSKVHISFRFQSWIALLLSIYTKQTHKVRTCQKNNNLITHNFLPKHSTQITKQQKTMRVFLLFTKRFLSPLFRLLYEWPSSQ